MKLLREPLLHFLVIGAILFGVFHLAGAGDEAAPDEIVVSAGQIASMKAIFSRTWQRPPTEKEVEALVSEYVRDEVLYREGVAMGLDRDCKRRRENPPVKRPDCPVGPERADFVAKVPCCGWRIVIPSF